MWAYLIGLIGAVLAVWLVPAWLLPWVIGIGFLAWVYFCVVQSGYPAAPTYAWAIPVAVALVIGSVGHSRATQLTGIIGAGVWLTMYAYEPARRFWYVRIFRWRFDRSP